MKNFASYDLTENGAAKKRQTNVAKLKLVTKVTKSSCPISIHGRSLLEFY